MLWEIGAVRVILVIVITAAAAYLHPFGLSETRSAILGLALGILFILLEIRLEKASLKRLIGATFGAILGILGALAIGHLLRLTAIDKAANPFFLVTLLLLMGYVGLVLGATKSEMLNLGAMGGLFAAETAPRKNFKVLDTSVIIDGRIADVCEASFIDGTLIIPQFVLRELQAVADSSDSLKRNRGRRGLDVLARMQKMSNITVRIVEDDFPQLRDVDLKLIELARAFEGKVVTNDFNLNKVAQLQGVTVLNINELANTLKPVVLPSETMRVLILKEGREYNQGIAYLDDGTMVVVDNAKKMISRTVDISVTSVLQTTAGKMIFGKYEERRALVEVLAE